VIPYAELQDKFPNLDSRQYIFIAISKLRRVKKADIVNVPHIGYRYMGERE